MTLTCHTISYHRGQEGFNSTENSNCKCRRDQSFDGVVIHCRCNRRRHRQTISQFREFRANRSDVDISILPQQHWSKRSHYQCNQWARNLFNETSPNDDNQETTETHRCLNPIDVRYILDIRRPLRDEPRRDSCCDTQEVLHLCRENRHCDTRGETHYDWIWDELKDSTHATKTHDDEKHPCHDGCNGQPL